MTEESDEDAFLWVQALLLTPGMLSIYESYLQLQARSAQVDMDAAIDKNDISAANRAKGKRDAFDALLHHVRTRAEGPKGNL